MEITVQRIILSANAWNAATGPTIEANPFDAGTPQALAWADHDSARRAAVAHSQRTGLLRAELRDLEHQLHQAEIANRLDLAVAELDRHTAVVRELAALADHGSRLAAAQARAAKRLEDAMIAALPWAA